MESVLSLIGTFLYVLIWCFSWAKNSDVPGPNLYSGWKVITPSADMA